MKRDHKFFLKLSQRLGARKDFVQGAGGNISVKMANGAMIIKASGVRLRELRARHGWVLLDRENTILSSSPATRPSMEFPMHRAIPSRIVVHTHPIAVNVFACSRHGKTALSKILRGLSWVWIPYFDPGDRLAAAIARLCERRLPPILILQNHGLITHGEKFSTVERLTLQTIGRCSQELPQNLRRIGRETSQHRSRGALFPDAAVLGTLSSTDGKENLAAQSRILQAMVALGKTPKFLSSAALRRLLTMESEKYRRSLQTTGR